MKIVEVGVLYIRFLEIILTARRVAEGSAIGDAADGRIAGVESLDACQRLGDPEVFRRVIPEDIAPASPVAGRRT
ncbi:MAG: hypothetical protein J7452_04235 [Thermoflexus sp.]|jgi:uncharacterized protein YuzE|nr:hypothetical protein [Thermoflexus sp.]